MILITGATATSGSEIVKQLVAKTVAVRALVRNPEKAKWLLELGVEIVQGDFNDPDKLKTALKGVEKALMLPPIDPNAVDWQSNFIEAAKSSKTKHVVKFSGMGANPDSPITLGRMHGQAEKLLEASGLAFTHLRPNNFMQNCLGFQSTIASQGAFYQPAGNGKIAHVDVRDIAAVAVKVLTEPGHEGKAYDITGPEALDFHQVGSKISAAIAKPVQYVNVSPEQFKQSLMNWGQSEWVADAVNELYQQVYQKGYAATVTDSVSKIARKQPISFDQFVQDHLAILGG